VFNLKNYLARLLYTHALDSHGAHAITTSSEARARSRKQAPLNCAAPASRAANIYRTSGGSMSRTPPHLKPSSTSHTTTSILSASCTARSTRALFSPRAATSSYCSSSLLSLGRPPRPVRARRGNTAIGCVPPSTVPSSSSSSSGGAAADPSAAMAKSVRVTATATIEVTVGGFLNSLRPSRAIDEIRDFVGRSLYLELVSSELDASKQLALHHLTLPDRLLYAYILTCKIVCTFLFAYARSISILNATVG
jgi:hypothetical protein